MGPDLIVFYEYHDTQLIGRFLKISEKPSSGEQIGVWMDCVGCSSLPPIYRTAVMTEEKTQQVPWSILIQEGHLSRILVLCFGVWLYAADSTLVATVMPVAVEDIGGIPYLSWTYSLYQLGSVVTGAIAGLMVIHIGIAQAQILAGIIYILGCAVSGYAPDMPTMIVGRLLQGMGGGGLVSIAFVGASTLFPKKLWVRIIAAISGVWGVSSLCGPLIGGYFVSGGNWRGAFWAFAIAGPGQQCWWPHRF